MMAAVFNYHSFDHTIKTFFMQSYLKSALEPGCWSVEIRMPVGGRPECKEKRDADAGRLFCLVWRNFVSPVE